MKIEIIYHEIKRKEFRSEKTLRKFLRGKLKSEILRAMEIKNGTWYALEMNQFLNEKMHGDEE